MQSPKKKKTSLAIHTKLSICMWLRVQSVLSSGHLNKRRIREDRIKWPFFTMQRINPLGSTVSITSMLYCIYRLILLLWV
ncbi:unnamed protein product [Staurois parvus]|uniref:Uncharacterized protein n=1 Tax=Staurois parvus TaxID=386267 RepID=A0ABN9CQ37_9NEOB|nr:unnamed protein product [Staurois parvus]